MKLLKLLLAAGLLGLLSVQTIIVHANPPVILVYGDSLSAEYGIFRGAGWVAPSLSPLKMYVVASGAVNMSGWVVESN